MTINNMYLKRLLKYARFLGSAHLKDVLFTEDQIYDCDKANSGVEHFDWALRDLPIVFPRH